MPKRIAAAKKDSRGRPARRADNSVPVVHEGGPAARLDGGAEDAQVSVAPVVYRVPGSNIVLSPGRSDDHATKNNDAVLPSDFQSLSRLVRRLHWRPDSTTPTAATTIWLSQDRISQLLSIPRRLVRGILHGEEQTNLLRISRRRQSRTLTAEHIDFLTRSSTLAEWREYSLAARTVLFHRRYPDKFISVRGLRRVYRAHGIQKRRMKPSVFLTVSQLSRQRTGRLAAFPIMIDAIENDRPIYFLDEACFTSN